MKKRILAALLALILILAGGSASGAEETGRTGDVVILYTGDIHCGINQGFGYAGLQAIREYLISQGNDVILVDVGDNIQGEPVGTLSKGEIPLELMNAMQYDIAIPGNHEFDYGMEQFLSLAAKAKFPYISCNFNKEGELVFDPYIIKEAGGTKIGFVGVCTPETLTDSTPKFFQDSEGNFIYGFMQDETGETLYGTVQATVDAARAEGAEYVIVLGHLGNSAESSPYNYADVISHVSGIDVMLDGHSHDTDQVIMKDKDGSDVVRSASGTKLANIGWCRISADGEVTAGLYTWINGTAAPALLGLNNGMSRAVDRALSKLDSELTKVVAKAQIDLTIFDPEAVDSSKNPIRMVRRAETNLGDLCADAFRDQSGADVAMISGGGIRSSIPAGDITYNDILRVNPFGNEMYVIEATGQQILDALEWGARVIPGENGGFLQVSGMSYEIHSYLENPCTEDENGFFAGISGERRVQNVRIGDKPIDPEARYSVAGINYTLLNHGDGFTMFDGATVLKSRVKLDNQVLIDYISGTLGGVVGGQYESLTGQDRIVIFDQKP
ncbi:MAG: bifunctional metallophosphatase/5'-nucleotidase [Clostridia bacterium]|nr:bifunctional metallophosphatase/5'-nucleotidase [Clostridia bacterium]